MWMVERSEAAGVKTSEVRDWRSETGDQRLEVRDWRSETGGQRLEVRDWRPEAGSRRSQWNFCVMKLDPRGGYRGDGGGRGGGS